MMQTVYAVMTTEELTNYAQLRSDATEMEVELAQRLSLAADKITDLEKGCDGCAAGNG